MPLLLDEWRTLYPNSSESVKTFLDKIKHLKSQKEEIKRHLEKSGLMPKFDAAAAEAADAAAAEFRPDTPGSAPDTTEPFKWHRSMIKDVLESHKRAKMLKHQQVAENAANGVNGKQGKPSFHALWEQEFR